jgi:hypothetical protein
MNLFWRQAPRDTRQIFFFFQLNTYGHSPYITSSLMREWVCRLQLLIALPEQSLSGPSPAGRMTTLYCLRFDTPHLKGQVPVFISPRSRVALLYPPALGSLFFASWISSSLQGGFHSLAVTMESVGCLSVSLEASLEFSLTRERALYEVCFYVSTAP